MRKQGAGIHPWHWSPALLCEAVAGLDIGQSPGLQAGPAQLYP